MIPLLGAIFAGVTCEWIVGGCTGFAQKAPTVEPRNKRETVGMMRPSGPSGTRSSVRFSLAIVISCTLGGGPKQRFALRISKDPSAVARSKMAK
jgi:hypothetical protein